MERKETGSIEGRGDDNRAGVASSSGGGEALTTDGGGVGETSDVIGFSDSNQTSSTYGFRAGHRQSASWAWRFLTAYVF